MPFMVLELLTGGSLRGLLDAGARLHARRRRRTSAARSPSALEYAHARGRRAPRHQARQPALRRARHRARRRLRPRARARRGELDRAGRNGGRHRALRGARAGDRRAARRPRRPLLARGGAGARRSPAPCPRSPTPRSARWRCARTPRSSRRSSSGASARSSSAPAARTPPSAIPTPPPCAPRSPTPHARCRRRSRSPLAGLGGEHRRRRPHADRPARARAVRPGRARRPTATVAGRRDGGRGADAPRRAPGAVRWVSAAVLGAVLLALVGGGVALAASASGGDRGGAVGRRAHDRRRPPTRSPTPGSTSRVIEQHGRRPEGRRDRAAPRAGGVHARRRRRSSWSCRAGRRRSRCPTSTASRPPTPRPRCEHAGFAVNVKHQYDEIGAGRRRHRYRSGRRREARRATRRCSCW